MEALPPDAVLRAFLAIEIPESLRTECAHVQSLLRRTGAHVGCPDPACLHLTLCFLGATFAAQVPAIAQAMDRVAQEVRPFSLEAAGVGAFGKTRPHVIWMGIGAAPGLLTLQRRLAGDLHALGFPPETRPFHPHITLARVKSGFRASELTSCIAPLVYQHFGAFEVVRIVLYRSHLDRPRPAYSILHTAMLKGM